MSNWDPKALSDYLLKMMGYNSTPQPQASFSITPKPQADKAKAVADKKPVPFSGIPGYSEHGAPADWDTAMGEVFGYRWWYLVVPPELAGYHGFTTSPAFDKTLYTLYGANNQGWHDGRMTAVCTKAGVFSSFATMGRQGLIHLPPETREACGCGFWAYFNRGLNVTDVLASGFGSDIPRLFSFGAGIPVFGVVKGTGRVIVGEKGFRSQYAQIVGLCIPPVAVRQLRWCMIPGNGRRNDSGSTWDDLWAGRTDSLPPLKEECSQAETESRISQLECILSSGYPSAKIFTSQDLLTKYFPPDKNYA